MGDVKDAKNQPPKQPKTQQLQLAAKAKAQKQVAMHSHSFGSFMSAVENGASAELEETKVHGLDDELIARGKNAKTTQSASAKKAHTSDNAQHMVHEAKQLEANIKQQKESAAKKALPTPLSPPEELTEAAPAKKKQSGNKMTATMAAIIKGSVAQALLNTNIEYDEKTVNHEVD